MATIGAYLRAQGLGEAAMEVEYLQSIADEARAVVHSTYSHISGRDLLAELHPRSELDIKRRNDGRDTWHEGDWLSDLHRAIGPLRALLFHPPSTVSRVAHSLDYAIDHSLGLGGTLGAQGMEAGTGETALAGSTESEASGNSPVGAADAP